MNSKQRVLDTLNFNSPDKIPVDIWLLPAVKKLYGEKLQDLLKQANKDIETVNGYIDIGFNNRDYAYGTHTDEWGNEWLVLQEGMIGEVKKPALESDESIFTYTPPIEDFLKGYNDGKNELTSKIADLRKQNKFIGGGAVSFFERMQYLRGTEQLYCDIALRSDEFFKIREYVLNFYIEYLNEWVTNDVDAICFGDDWGTQISLLISKKDWVELFKPMYARLFEIVKSAGKHVFFHSDGYILDLYEEFIELGVSAINSQIWCMGIEKVEKYAGKITFWGEISRQETLPFGTPKDIEKSASLMKKHLYKNGGLIGQCEAGKDVSFENIKAALNCW